MYIIENAVKNLARNKGRNILIAAITLAIIVSTVVTLTINNAAAKIIDNIRLDLGSRVEVRQDFIEMRQAGLDGRRDASYISIDSFMAFSQSEYLQKSIFNADMYAWSNTFRAVDDYGETPGETTRVNDNGEVVLVETCKLVSISDPEALTEFGSLREIVAGRMFEGLNECVISVDAAALNQLNVGDTIEIRGTYAADKNYHLTIAGIYADSTEPYANFFLRLNGRFADNRRNEIITSFDTLMSAGWETNAGLDMKNAYYLKNPDDIGKFESELRVNGLPLTYNVAINQAAYDKVTGPLAGMKGAAVTFMVVILILGAIVLALLSFMAVRERKYEVGVLRAMGMERIQVVFGMLSETVMIASVCLLAGIGLGIIMAQPIADSMLEGRVAVAQESDTGPSRVLFAGGQFQTNDNAQGYEPESEISVSLGADVIMQIIFITLCLAALSGVIGVAAITQYEPLKILRERN
jgi:putative ABC transport system permease protein